MAARRSRLEVQPSLVQTKMDNLPTTPKALKEHSRRTNRRERVIQSSDETACLRISGAISEHHDKRLVLKIADALLRLLRLVCGGCGDCRGDNDRELRPRRQRQMPLERVPKEWDVEQIVKWSKPLCERNNTGVIGLESSGVEAGRDAQRNSGERFHATV